jgi:outer membrane protein assembly factor BamA
MRGNPCVVVLCAVAAATLCAWTSAPAQSVLDLQDRPIVAIEFECPEPIDAPGLTALLPMKTGDVLRPRELQAARRRLQQTRLFSKVEVEAQARGDGVVVVAHLRRKAIVNRIRLEGNKALKDRELLRVLRIRENMALTDKLRDYSVRHLEARYAADGFDAASIEAEVRTRSPGEVDVIFHIAEGAPLRIGAIELTGTLPVPEEQIRKVLGLRVGDRYVRERQRKAEKAIVQLLREKSFYEAEVESTWQPGQDKSGTVRFTIDPGPPFRLEFSGNPHFSDARLLKLIELAKRPIITDGSWRELARRARRAYEEKGYYFAKVDVSIQPGAPKTVHVTVDEGRTFRVASVEFEGNRGVSARTLRAVMGTSPPSWIPWRRGALLDDVIDDDMNRLWYAYRRHGFQSAEIVDQRTRFDHEKGQVFITVVVDERRQTLVRQIERTGMEPIAGQLPKLALKVGKPLDPEVVENDRRALATALAMAGYTHARVETHIDSEPGGEAIAATVRFDATGMEQHHVGRIIVQNNFDTRASVITRELPFSEGDPLDPQALLRGQTNIYKLGIFRSVTVRPLRASAEAEAPASAPAARKPVVAETDETSGEPILLPVPDEAHPAPVTADRDDIVVNVAEKPPGSLQWGAGYNTRDGVRGFLEVSHDNLQGLARRLSLRGEVNMQPGDTAPNEYLGNLGFREPRLEGTQWTVRSNLIAQRSTRKVDQFSLERFAFIPGFERTFLPGLQAGLEAQFEQAQVFDLAPDVVNFNPRDQGRLRSSSLGPFAVYDGRDDPFSPRRGVFDSVRLRIAPGELGSDIPFFKVFAQHAQYIPLGDDLTFVYVARGGWARAYEKSSTVPIRERFFLGGRTTVRGFSENQIGPQGRAFTGTQGNVVPGGDPLGGTLMLNLNVEFRFPLAYGFGGVVFTDGGGLYQEVATGQPGSCAGCGSINLHDFRRSAGLGLRYNTPVGPVTLDYGFKLDRRGDESIGEVHFSIGPTF